jgi:hypothetical protein
MSYSSNASICIAAVWFANIQVSMGAEKRNEAVQANKKSASLVSSTMVTAHTARWVKKL